VDSFAVARSSGWSALVVFAATAVVVSELAARSRRRAREAELLARTARSLLERGGPGGSLDAIAAEAALVFGARRARIVLGRPSERVPGELEQPLVVGGRQVGQIFLEGIRRGSGVARARMLPALSSLLAVAIEHDRLSEEAYRAEALRRSDEVKTAIIRAVSHDLRTPLATMETALGSLRDSSFALSPDDRRELLDAIGAEHGRLKRLVENLLDLSRLQAGAAEPAPELWAVDQLLIDALEEVDAGARIDVAVVPERVPLVRVDAVQIERVLANLLENALKFSPSDAKVRVRVHATRDEVIIRVVNQGSGIPSAELDRIFEPFQRLAGARGSGAGLGLAIAKGFAEANGGRVRAESRPGQGASFTLTLPAIEATTLVPA
jgi:two-component system sensor histidine kinase KdpD